jgi:hypothetical protein
MILTLLEHVPPFACDSEAVFGYGIGTGPPGVGVLHTSGTMKQLPPLFVDAGNMECS